MCFDLLMFCGGEGKKWTCGNAGVVRLQKVASFVLDLSQPCLSQSGIQVLLNVRSFLLLFLLLSARTVSKKRTLGS